MQNLSLSCKQEEPEPDSRQAVNSNAVFSKIRLFGQSYLPYNASICYSVNITNSGEGAGMYFEIDFESDEAIYRQLCRQIIFGIATNLLHEGDSLPSVRDMADEIGINMHTVNKAYTILRQEGFLTVDRRKGAVIYIDDEKMRAVSDLKKGPAHRTCQSKLQKNYKRRDS